MRILTFPAEAKTPLIVDPNAVLPTTVALERFQAIAGRQTQDVESVGGIELQELSSGGALDVRWQVTRSPAAEEFFSLVVGKTLDHDRERVRSADVRKPNSYARRNFTNQRTIQNARIVSPHKLVAHFRRSRGPDINAACGQLRRRTATTSLP